MSDTPEFFAPASAHESHFGSYNNSPESVAKLVAALVAAQSQFKEVVQNCTGTVQPKDGRPGFTFKYADYHAYREASKAALSSNNLMTTFTPIQRNGTEYLRLYILHTAGGYLVAEAEMPHVNDGPISKMMQAYGGSQSFLRRYLYRAALDMSEHEQDGLDPEDLSEITGQRSRANSASAPYPKHPDISKAASVSELSKVMTKLEKADKAKFAEHYNARAAELRQAPQDEGHEGAPE